MWIASAAFFAVFALAHEALAPGSRLDQGTAHIGTRRADASSIQTAFWGRQGVSLLTAVVMILGLVSIWFNDPTRLTTAFGLMSAGLDFALQKVITSIAGYQARNLSRGDGFAATVRRA